MGLKEEAIKERGIRELEKRHSDKRESLVSFIRYFFETEKGKPFDDNWHYHAIEEKLKQVLEGTCNRLIINIPPGSGKTELITKSFPVWAMGIKPTTQIIATGYSTSLTQTYGSEARDYYRSTTFRRVFPRRPDIREDTNAKGLWRNEVGGQYLATGTGGAITGNRCNIFIIDDPIKPDEAESDIIRTGVNNWFDNTVISRLFNPLKDAIIIIMQRTHEDDLCGHVMEKMRNGTGEHWDTLILPAIATEDEVFRKSGEALQINRYPLESLDLIKKSLGNSNFSAQYQQNPIDKDSQEFHEEWFRYYDNAPASGRIFTAVDPAFKKGENNDYSAIVTGKFVGDELYILEYSVGRLDPGELIDKISYHIKKWNPEKVGIEAFQAQSIIGFNLNNTLQKEGIYVNIEDIKQAGDKETKIRKLIPLYRNGLIYHKIGMEDGKEVGLEAQLLKFPKGRNDDVIDALQMVYDLYTLQPNTQVTKSFKIEYGPNGRPMIR